MLGGGPQTAEAGEESAGRGDIAGDFGAELVGAGEFLFVAEALPKLDFDADGRQPETRTTAHWKIHTAGLAGRSRVSVAGKNVAAFEDVRFDGDGRAVEGGADADVRDGTAGR